MLSNLHSNFCVIPVFSNIYCSFHDPVLDILQLYFTADFTSNQPVRLVLSVSEHWLLSDIALTIVEFHYSP